VGEMVRISKLKNTKVLVNFDEEANLVIRREYKNTYKYDLDFFMNFDLEKERKLLIEKVKSNNFINSFAKEAVNMTRFVNLLDKSKIRIKDKKNFHLHCEELVDRFDILMKQYFKTNLINFSDLKSALDKFDSLPTNKIQPFLNSLIRILNIPADNKPNNNNNITRELQILSDFSNGIFIEKEILSLAYLMFEETLKNSNDNKIPLINNEFNSHNKKNFKTNVVLKSLKKSLRRGIF